MNDKREDERGCLSMPIILGIFIIGLVIRILLGDGVNLMKDMWFGLLGILILLGVVWVANNYKKN